MLRYSFTFVFLPALLCIPIPRVTIPSPTQSFPRCAPCTTSPNNWCSRVLVPLRLLTLIRLSAIRTTFPPATPISYLSLHYPSIIRPLIHLLITTTIHRKLTYYSNIVRTPTIHRTLPSTLASLIIIVRPIVVAFPHLLGLDGSLAQFPPTSVSPSLLRCTARRPACRPVMLHLRLTTAAHTVAPGPGSLVVG